MKNSLMALFAASVLFVSAANAANPLSITFTGDSQSSNGTTLKTFQVKCSDNKTPTISKADSSNQWCVGDQAEGKCSSKKVKTAQAACK